LLQKPQNPNELDMKLIRICNKEKRSKFCQVLE